MKINQIVSETTTSGAIATVEQSLSKIQKRPVTGLTPVGKKPKKAGPYANSINEGKVKELAMDLKNNKDGLNDQDFKKKYGKSKEEMRKSMQQKPKNNQSVQEAKLDEDDLILVPGQGLTKKTGFVKHDPDRAEHEGQTLKNSLHTIIRVATHLDRELSTRDNFPEWVSEKIGAIKSNMVTVMDYLISAKEMGARLGSNEGMSGGVIAGGGVGEGLNAQAVDDIVGNAVKNMLTKEGKKVDRMVNHIAKSERGLGHGEKEAETIAWKTVNKRGMLDNKNKKK